MWVGTHLFPAEPPRGSASSELKGAIKQEEENPKAKAGWAGSPELVKHDSPFFQGWGCGARTWGPCSVITNQAPHPRASHTLVAGLELLNSAVQGGMVEGGEREGGGR